MKITQKIRINKLIRLKRIEIVVSENLLALQFQLVDCCKLFVTSDIMLRRHIYLCFCRSQVISHVPWYINYIVLFFVSLVIRTKTICMFR